MSERGEPRVAVVMGSDSDLAVMLEAARALNQLGIAWEIHALSAHRTPHRVSVWAEDLEGRGIRVVIAGAGGAAHLPGAIAALTPLPVIGVPLKSVALDGLDSLLSIAQMPPGVPVATVGVDAARNAGILAAEVLGVGDPAVRERVRKLKVEMAAAAEERDSRLMERVEKELGRG